MLRTWVAIVGVLPLSGTDLKVSASPEASGRLNVRVAWNNAWRNDRNHDAAWIFVKYRQAPDGWRHARIAPAQADGPAAVTVPADGAGAFVCAKAAHRGPVSWTIPLRLEAPAPAPNAPVEWRAFGVEMVYIPEGPFWLGDPDADARRHGAFFRVPGAMWRVESEAAIPVGAAAGQLNYDVQTAQYQGDRQGPIPAAFPKGFRAFYIMKYELRQGPYAEFLNHVSEGAANFRSIHGGLNYYAQRGSIRVREGRFAADAPDRPANWVSWADGVAYADWAGLRPMTEFEFTKAARGPDDPAPGAFPWGTASKDRLKRQIVPPGDDIAGRDESELSEATRDVFGASFYWVMDLAGSVWERAVTPAHSRGRAFEGSHGDGRLTGYGAATNPDWPKADEGEGGFGYRGGGYYEHGFNAGPFNPHSRTEWRRFGAWGEAPRSVAYGFRGVRTAP